MFIITFKKLDGKVNVGFASDPEYLLPMLQDLQKQGIVLDPDWTPYEGKHMQPGHFAVFESEQVMLPPNLTPEEMCRMLS